MAKKELSRDEFLAERNAGDIAAMKHRPGADDENGMKRLLFLDGWMARAHQDDRPVAPWPDFAGNPIRHGDRLAHPTGEEFTAVWLKGHEHEGDAWRAVYDDATMSRLGLQIGDKGQAVLVSGEKGNG